MFDLEFIHVDVYVGVKTHVGGNVGVKTHVRGVETYVRGVKFPRSCEIPGKLNLVFELDYGV